ncbi:MAG: hypothetical protein BJ554DRAFT_1078, partial [Olpidium bornovanus]
FRPSHDDNPASPRNPGVPQIQDAPHDDGQCTASESDRRLPAAVGLLDFSSSETTAARTEGYNAIAHQSPSAGPLPLVAAHIATPALPVMTSAAAECAVYPPAALSHYPPSAVTTSPCYPYATAVGPAAPQQQVAAATAEGGIFPLQLLPQAIVQYPHPLVAAPPVQLPPPPPGYVLMVQFVLQPPLSLTDAPHRELTDAPQTELTDAPARRASPRLALRSAAAVGLSDRRTQPPSSKQNRRSPALRPCASPRGLSCRLCDGLNRGNRRPRRPPTALRGRGTLAELDRRRAASRHTPAARRPPGRFASRRNTLSERPRQGGREPEQLVWKPRRSPRDRQLQCSRLARKGPQLPGLLKTRVQRFANAFFDSSTKVKIVGEGPDEPGARHLELTSPVTSEQVRLRVAAPRPNPSRPPFGRRNSETPRCLPALLPALPLSAANMQNAFFFPGRGRGGGRGR